MIPEDHHAAQMARTLAPPTLNDRQFSGDELAARARGIKAKAMQRAMPQPGNVQPYLPFGGPT